MKITTFSDYALRVMIYLALNPEQKSTVDEISTAYDISFHHVAKAAQWLTRMEYVKSERGRGGGIMLNKSPNAINIGTVIRTAEAGSPLVDCMREGGGACCIAPACRLKHALAQAENAFYLALEQFTLADITLNQTALEALLSETRAPV